MIALRLISIGFYDVSKPALLLSVAVNASAQALTSVDQEATYPSAKVVDCVFAEPARAHLLETLGTIQIYTHPCTSGLYLADLQVATGDGVGQAIPVVQGWILQSLLGVKRTSADIVLVSGRFVTGVGPVGARPFNAQITVRREVETWHADEPVLTNGREP